MSATERTYQAYLLRLWRDGAEGTWRASLQSTRDSNHHLFANVKSLLTFLEAQTTLEIQTMEQDTVVLIAPDIPPPL